MIIDNNFQTPPAVAKYMAEMVPRSERGWITFEEYNKDCMEDMFYDGFQIKCRECGSVRVIWKFEPKFYIWCDGCKEIRSAKKFKIV